MSVSIPASTTGWFSDTTNVDDFDLGDYISTQLVVGAGGTSVSYNVFVDVHLDNGNTYNLWKDAESLATSLTRYIALGGADVSDTELFVQAEIGQNVIMRRVGLGLNVNNITAATTFTSRKEVLGSMVDGLIAISAIASTSGWFFDMDSEERIDDTQNFNWKLVTGGTGTTLTLSIIHVEIETNAFARVSTQPPDIDNDTAVTGNGIIDFLGTEDADKRGFAYGETSFDGDLVEDMFHEVVDTFTADGTWTCPAGVLEAIVECWGAGAGGTTNVGAGGGGAFARKTVAVTPSTGYAVVVGTSAANTNGEDSTFDSTTVVAKGGLSGTNGGTAGQASASTGDIKFNGGNGGVGTGTRSGGAGAGARSAGSTITAGLDQGGQGRTSAGKLIAAGGGSATASQQTGARGEVRVRYKVARTAGYPYIVARAYGRTSTAATKRDINMPTGIKSGDLIVAIIGCDGTDAGGGDHVLTGFTRLDLDTNGSAVVGSVHYKVSSGDEPQLLKSYTTTASEQIGSIVLVIRGYTGTPSCTSANGSSTDADPPSHDAGASHKHLWIAAAVWDEGDFASLEKPSGYGDFVYTVNGFAGGAGVALATKFATSQTEDPAVFTSPTEQWAAFTIAVQGDDLDPFVGGDPQDQYDSKAEDTGTFSTGAFQKAISGLTPNTTYYIRAYAHTSEGYFYGDEETFLTPTAVAVTKSLRYAVTSEHAATKSLRYVVTSEQAETKSLTYSVVVEGATTKSLTYRVITQGSETKSLTYAVLVEVAVTKSLSYEVTSEQAVTKSLKYCVISQQAATLSLTYIVVVQETVTKSLTYLVESVQDITKSLKYVVETTPSALTKSLAYFILQELPVTKSLTYEVLTSDAITKSLAYFVETVTALQKSLTYEVLQENTVTKSLSYEVLTSSTLTKQLRYSVVSGQALTKSLTYGILSENGTTKQLTYAVITSGQLTKSLTYAVQLEQAVTKSLQYIVIIQTVLQKGLTYVVVREMAITKSLHYEVVADIGLTKSLTYSILHSPYSPVTDGYTPDPKYTRSNEYEHSSGFTRVNNYSPL